MKHATKIVLILLAATLLSACGAEATPTINFADVQNTAVAAAFTIVAETQVAIPTATPPPTETPTQTPLPTITPLPTLAVTLTNTPLAGASYCDTRILGSPRGRETRILVVNTTRAPVTVSLFLNETADHNECGWRTYNLSSRGSVTITDLVQGCYNVGAFVNDPRQPSRAFGYGCINNPDKWTFEIYAETIKFIGP